MSLTLSWMTRSVDSPYNLLLALLWSRLLLDTDGFTVVGALRRRTVPRVEVESFSSDS